MTIKIKRAYEAPNDADGKRILVDRLWPRGLSKERARLDLWLKEIAPSTELRKWFSHDPARWAEFRRRYLDELKSHSEQLAQLKQEAKRGPVTLVFGARDVEHNEAVILCNMLQKK